MDTQTLIGAMFIAGIILGSVSAFIYKSYSETRKPLTLGLALFTTALCFLGIGIPAYFVENPTLFS